MWYVYTCLFPLSSSFVFSKTVHMYSWLDLRHPWRKGKSYQYILQNNSVVDIVSQYRPIHGYCAQHHCLNREPKENGLYTAALCQASHNSSCYSSSRIAHQSAATLDKEHTTSFCTELLLAWFVRKRTTVTSTSTHRRRQQISNLHFSRPIGDTLQREINFIV